MFRRLSVPVLAFLVIAVLALAGSLAFYFSRPGLPSNKDPEAVRLKAERDALSDYSDSSLASIEVRQRDAQNRLPAQADVAKFIDELRANWTIQSLGRVDAKHVGTRRYMLTNKNQRFRGSNDRQWSDVVSAVKAIDERPGFVIQSIVISSSVNQGVTYGQVAITVAVGSRDDMPATVVTVAPAAELVPVN